jgi:hypothetical protein
MRLFPLLGSFFLLLWGCAPSQSLWHPGGRSPDATDARVVESLLVRDALEGSSPGEWAVFLPVDLEAAGLDGWSVGALQNAGYLVDIIELEDEGEDSVEPGQFRASEDGTGELRMRRPPRRGGPGRSLGRRPPLLNPRSPPEERLEIQRRAADLEAVHASRNLYSQRLAEAQARYPNSTGYQEHHFVPMYLGGAKDGVTYRLPTAYHLAITQEFRRHWGYGTRRRPEPEQRLEIMIKVYSKYPIPQLVGINP